MNWKAFLSTLERPEEGITFGLQPPAAYAELDHLKEHFDLQALPKELETLYLQTNGVSTIMDGDIMGDLVWPIQKVIELNKEQRSYPAWKDLFMSFDQLLFVSDAGNGDLFGYVVLNGEIRSTDILTWNHEDDSRKWVAENLASFMRGWTDGSISV